MRALFNKWAQKFVSVLAALAFLTACESFEPSQPSALQIRNDQGNVIDQKNVVVLVRTEQAANSLIINAARRNYQLNTKENLKALDLILLDFKRPPGVSGVVAIGDMQRAEPSATAGLDHFYTLQTTPEKRRGKQPRLFAQSMVAWPDNGCRAQLVVGMIDGFVDVDAPILKSANIRVRNFARGKPTDIQHGTAIADLLVGRGRLSGAHLYSASVISDANKNQTGAGVPELIRALNWMQQSGVSVVNISLAGPYNKLLDRAIQQATAKGMLIIAAVGNDGPHATPRYPAAFKDVIAVTAIDSAREVYVDAVHGDHVDFSAPGVDVFIEYGADGEYLSGTSVAAPFVTALIAGDANLTSGRGVEAVRSQLARDAIDLGLAGRDPVYGTGLIRAEQTCQL